MNEYRIVITGWIPSSLNKLGGHWGKRVKLKDSDADAIALACHKAGVPKVATPMAEKRARKALEAFSYSLPPLPAYDKVRRRIRIEMTLPKGQRMWDQDNMLKSLCDGLKRGGYIVDDSPKWAEPTLPFPYYRGEQAETVIILEDLPPMAKITKRRKAS